VRGNGIYDLSTVRANFANPGEATGELRDRAMRAIDQAHYPHEDADEGKVKTHVERLLNKFGSNEHGAPAQLQEFARRLLVTGSPTYQRAFGKAFVGRPLNDQEMRALSLTDASGGYAVPFTLDPTIIPTSNGQQNPLRAISRVESIMTDTWQGVSSAGVTATRRAEQAEAADNSPTLAQPTATPSRVDVFIPFSREIGQDWGSMQSEMAALIQDAKDLEEATSFATGDGNAPNPQGIETGATNTVAAGTASFAVAHLYSLQEALPPRFEANARFVGHQAQFNRVRQFDTGGGASLWEYLGEGLPGRLLGYAAHRLSTLDSVLTAGSDLLIYGDFRYFLIVDRVGMSIDLIPHLFGTNRRPTGESGLFAFWRNTSKVLSASAFRKLRTT
jgi:HK97 family phage major capsid protein